jgi:putative RecB family exonuclease
LRLSFSKLALHEFCPYAYRFRYVERVPASFSAGLAVGSIVHAVLRTFFERIKSGLSTTCEDLHNLHVGYWENAPVLDRERFRDIWIRVEALLEEFWVANRDDFGAPVMLEHRFRLRVDGVDLHSIEGVIDRVDAISGGMEVIDYKSGSTPADLSHRIRTQLHTYALAVEHCLGCPVTRLTAYFLKENQTRSMVPDPEFAENLLERFRALGLAVSVGSFDPTPGPCCRHCDYRDRCAFRSTLALDDPDSSLRN